MTPSRRLKAWILNLLILSNWAGGCWCCLEVTYQVRTLHRMNEQEVSIASDLSRQFGIISQVKVSETRQSYLAGVYNSSFLFSQQTAGDTVFYQLVTSGKSETCDTMIIPPMGPGNEKDPYSVRLHNFFKDFIFWELPVRSFGVAPSRSGLFFVSVPCQPLPADILHPPPDRLA